jgi:fatty-acyl-CoA synthase
MGQSEIKPLSLVERLDILADNHGPSIAQSFVASGEPTDAPLEMTFAAFVAEVRRRSNALGALGVGPADVVAFAAPLAEKSYSTLVAGMVSATLAPVNYFLEADALIRIVRASAANALLIHRSFDDGADILERLKKVCAALPHLKLLSFGVGPEVEGAIDIESVAAGQSSTSWDGAPRNRSRDRVVALFHTGGTTGLPKLVPHTEAMYDAMIASCGAGEGTQPGESLLSGLPLFHTSGVLQAGLAPLFNATRVIIPSSRGFRDSKAIANYWRFVRRYGVTIGASVPTVLAALAGIEPDGPITSLKRVLVGGAPLAQATIARIAEKTGGAEVIEGWGMTETCGFSVLNPHGKTKVGSVGLPFPGVEMQIRHFGPGDARGESRQINETGELVVRGDIVIENYLDSRPGAFSEDGWLRTGDLGRIDADGYLWITGRLKDIIIRGGHNIDPALIEEPAYQHPAVQLAAAIGKPDKYAGELPVLYVQLKSGASISVEELGDFVRERILERAAVPKSIIIVPEIPLSGPGKISKLLLRRAAIAQAFQDEADRLGFADVDIRAEVVEDRMAGDIVVLSCAGALKLDAERREKVAAALSGFAVQFRWAEDASAMADNEREQRRDSVAELRSLHRAAEFRA